MGSIRRVAHIDNRTISEVVNELFVEGMQRRKRKEKTSTFKLPSFAMGKSRINIGDSDALWSIIES